MIEDTYRHKGLRKGLVEELKKKGITDERVLMAIGKIPRHLFIKDSAFTEKAYEDKAFPIGEGQTISQPFTVAYQSQLLNIQKRDHVLEIGTGSGYQSAVLLELGAKLFTIERQKLLYEKTKKFLPTLGYIPKFFYGDGSKGIKAFAPFDKIIVTAGAPFVPESLLAQLKIDGLLVIPVGDNKIQKMLIIKKIAANEYEQSELEQFRFVPLLGDEAWGA